MKKVSSVKINFIMNFILTISNFIFPLITFPYVSRILLAEGIGTVNFATSIVAYFSMLGMLGIPTYGIRACAKIRDDKEKLNKTVIEIMILNAIVMSIALVLLLVSVLSIEKLYTERMLYLILSSTLVFNVLGVDWLYRSLEKYTYITIRSIVFKFISVILMFLFVHQTQDHLIYGAISVFAAVGSNVLNFINLRKLISIPSINDLNIFQHLKPTLTFFLLTVSSTIYLNVDTTMLGFIKGSEAVGYYSAAVKIKQILVPTNREKLVVFSTIIGAVIDIIVNIFAIPMFGAGGAAFAGTIAEFSVALAQFIFLKDFILPILKKIDFIKIGLSLLLTTLVTSGLLAAINTGTFWTLLFSSIVYFAFYGISLLFQKEDFVLEAWETVLSKIKK